MADGKSRQRTEDRTSSFCVAQINHWADDGEALAYHIAESCNAYTSTEALKSALEACAEFLRNKGIPCGAYSMPAPGEIDAAQAAFDRELEAIIEEMKAEVPRMVEQRGARAIDTALSGSPAPSTEGLREWQPIAGAPRDQNIIVAAMNTYSKTYTVGEARWQSDDPDHPDDGDWWWDIPPGDYTVDSILNMNGPVEFWQPLPAAPDAARTALAGVTAPSEVDADEKP